MLLTQAARGGQRVSGLGHECEKGLLWPTAGKGGILALGIMVLTGVQCGCNRFYQ